MREQDRGAESRIVMPYTVLRSRSGAGRALTKASEARRAGGVRDKRVALRLDVPAPMKELARMLRNKRAASRPTTGAVARFMSGKTFNEKTALTPLRCRP